MPAGTCMSHPAKSGVSPVVTMPWRTLSLGEVAHAILKFLVLVCFLILITPFGVWLKTEYRVS